MMGLLFFSLILFGLFALLVARLHSPETRAYLRIRRPDGPGLGLAALGWAVLYPAVIWTGQLNESIPMPEWLRTLEQQQVDMLEGLLLGSELSTGFLFLALAITPALCEEVLFRGFILNGLRSRLSKWQCLMLNAVLFGALHMLVYQFVPTAALGLLLAWIAWETGSLLPCVLFHFLNNALALSFMHFTNYGESGDKLEAAGGWQAVLARLQGGAYPWWWAAAAAAMMVAGCWMMVKNGRMGKEGVMK